VTAETDIIGYCVDITSATINANVCSSNYLKVVPSSGTRSVECGGSGSIDKCAICTPFASFACSSPSVPI